MGVKRLDDLVAFKEAVAFKEGWRRFAAADMTRFLRHATGSLEEARVEPRSPLRRRHVEPDQKPQESCEVGK